MPVAGLKQIYSEKDDALGPHKNHPLYEKWSERWQEMRDALEGEKAIKADPSKYIEKPSAFDKTEFATFAARAEYPEAVQRTHRATLDRVFSKETKRTLPARLTANKDEILNRLDGAGLTFADLERWCFGEACAVHRVGLLADYDAVLGEPRLKRYNAESIFDWEFSSQGVLTRLVLDYPRPPEGPYMPAPQPARQVLILEPSGLTFRAWSVVYTRRAVAAGDGGVDTAEYEWFAEAPTPLESSGKALESLPFVFIGGANPQTSILQPLANIARAYLNVAADHRHQLHNSAFIQWWIEQRVEVGQVDTQLTIAPGVDLYGAELGVNGLQVEMGSSRVLQLRNASVNVTTPGAGTLDAHAAKLTEFKAQMVSYGARIFDQDVKANIAADTVWMQNSSNATSVASLAKLTGQGIADALEFAAVFGNFDGGEILIELNTDYFDDRFSVGDIAGLITGIDEGLFSKKDARHIMRTGGLQIGSDEEIEKDLQKEGFEEKDVVEPVAPKPFSLVQ